MQPDVVVDVDRLNNRSEGLLDVGECGVKKELGFEYAVDTLGSCILIWTSRSCHADAATMFFEHRGVVKAAILGSTVRVVDQVTGILDTVEGHAQSVHWTRGLERRREVVADDLPAEEVRDERQIAEPVSESDVGLIGHPDAIGLIDDRLRRQVGIDRECMLAVGGQESLATPSDQQAIITQNVKEPVATDAEFTKMLQELAPPDTRHELTKRVDTGKELLLLGCASALASLLEIDALSTDLEDVADAA